MAKFGKISLSMATAILALGFSGCGGGGSGTSSQIDNQQPIQPTPTTVTIERGAVYDANVTDAIGNKATQQNGKNVYLFADTPKYPVTVNGGWIDVDGDGKKTIEDIELTTTLKSYSTNVTPITTYIADANVTIRENRLNELSSKMNVPTDELLKLPSTGTTDAMLVHNSVFNEIQLNGTTDNLDVDIIKTKFDSYKTIANQSPDKNSTELMHLIEKEVVSNLATYGKVTKISLADADMTSDQKNIYSLGQDDFVLSNSLTNFTSVINGNLSTQYTSNEITFTGIDTPLSISINNSQFSIIKNDVKLSELNTTVSNGDRIKLQTTSSSNFSTSSTAILTISDKFTNVANSKLVYSAAAKLCSDVGLELPTGSLLTSYHLANGDKFPSNITEFWTKDSHSLSGFGKTYYTSTKTLDGALLSFDYGVICTKHYPSISYSVSTKSDPNQAPVAQAGADQKVYYLDAVQLDASSSTDDSGIVSYQWKDGTTVLSNTASFSKTDFSVGTHNLTLTVTDSGGKTSIDSVVVTIYNTFTNLLPVVQSSTIMSKSGSCFNSNCTYTISSGSDLYFKITNDTNRAFEITKMEITSTYNGTTTVRASSTDSNSLSGSSFNNGEYVKLGYTLSNSQTANYWTGTYYLTDVVTGQTFTNSLVWNGSSY